ncbi:MAG: lysophospholipid acyltransferase family protein [Chitinophagaceae bacterium]
MSIVKNFLGRILAFWTLLVFSVTLLIVLIPIWAIYKQPEPKRSVILQKIFTGWMKVFFVLIGVRRIIKGKGNFKKDENYIVVCNHSSFMDVPLSTASIPGPTKTIAKIEMSRIPLFGVVYKSGSVIVDRKSEESRKLSYRKMKEVLDMGLHMCIYPEGTRNKTGEPLQRFHDGAFRLAEETNKAIIPAIILNTKKVLPPDKKFFFWPHNVQMHFLPAVEITNQTVQQLKEQVFSLMKNYYISKNPQ